MEYCQRYQALREKRLAGSVNSAGGLLPERTGSAVAMDHPRPIMLTSMVARYPAVRALSMICRCLAFLALAAGMLVALFGLLSNKTGSGLFTSAVALFYSLGTMIVLLAVSEGMRIMVDIEANTRGAMEHLRRIGPQSVEAVAGHRSLHSDL